MDRGRDDSRWPEPLFILGWTTIPVHQPSSEAKTKNVALKPDAATPRGWLMIHRPHGRVWYECKIGDWHRWKCSCGDRFCFKDAERDADPNAYRL